MISCEKHDYFEIACLYQLPLEVWLSNGDVLRGVACDLKLSSEREECLVLGVDNDKQRIIVLSDIVALHARQPNPHFGVVNLV